MEKEKDRDTWFRRNGVALVGFAINILLLGVFLGRQMQIITQLESRAAALEQRMSTHHEDREAHTTMEWRTQVLQRLDRIDGKIDAHIMSDQDRNMR